MRYGANMMPMFLTVYLSNNDQHFTEVPVTPETLCRDVVELCKEPGEGECYLAEMWRGSERAISDGERMLDVLQRWGQQRGEVRFLLRHERAPCRESGGSRVSDHSAKRNMVMVPVDRCMENGVAPPRMDITLSELQEMASRQQQQINSQQQLLASKEQRLLYLRLQEQRQQQASEQERLRQLRENAENQETKLRRVRALKGQVEQKRQSNSKLVEEIEQMNGLFQSKQRELLVAVSRVEELSRQLETLKSVKMESSRDGPSSAGELERLYKELQVRNKLNQDQNAKLQQQRESLSKRNLEVATMDKRVAELRERLWKKKAALQQKENLPCYPNILQVPTKSQALQPCGPSRVAAVGPYILSSTAAPGPPVPSRQELLIKPAYPDGTTTLPMPDSSMKAPPRPLKPYSGFQSSKMSKLSDWSSSSAESSGSHHGMSSTLPRMSSLSSQGSGDAETLKDQKGRHISMFDTPPPVASRNYQSSEDLLRDAQAGGKALGKVPPPIPTKPPTFGKPPYSTGTFPGKAKPSASLHLCAPPPIPIHSHTLPLPPKQEAPPAATVRPFTPDPPESTVAVPVLQKPQTVAASSIYSMYTQQPRTGGGTLTRTQPRVYGKPVIPGSGGQQSLLQDSIYSVAGDFEVDQGGPGLAPPAPENQGGQETERAPRPLSPTKLLPFISHPHRHPSDADLEALRRRLHHAPRPLKKRSSITEPEGPAGPNIQKLLYQKTTLAAMETVVASPYEGEGGGTWKEGTSAVGAPDRTGTSQVFAAAASLTGTEEDAQVPLPQPSRSPIPEPSSSSSHTLPQSLEEEEPEPYPPPPHHTEAYLEEYPPYPPPPYPSSGEQDLGEDTLSMQAPEVTGQVTLPPGKRTNLRKVDSERIDHGMRVKFNPLALLLDSSLEGEYDLVQRVIYDVDDPSLPNDEGITALHNAVCAGHTEIVKFLVQFGVNANAADSDGWTPLHCAASCNNVQVCKFLVESGAAVFATTYSDMQTAADKCEEMEEGYAQCSQFLYGVQEKIGIMNRGVVYALWDYEAEEDDELAFQEGDCMTVLRREDKDEIEWWWARCGDREGYIPRNLLGLYLRIKPRQRSLA
ncbi:apoptosis-stimulating of p53 protein 2-like isoform X1 [Salvelinus namaycush]|uniref:Apoptosis-stimulating of p53 protein 2-like isoform X1 n=1 Tax=Salvelinus namaycush TaxID=8040 RepID=A0A8U1F966_SALNM|nr:apoptosis-stimulating of p53 protein 2-like isoform X1 [Salvelinus namaycush]